MADLNSLKYHHVPSEKSQSYGFFMPGTMNPYVQFPEAKNDFVKTPVANGGGLVPEKYSLQSQQKSTNIILPPKPSLFGRQSLHSRSNSLATSSSTKDRIVPAVPLNAVPPPSKPLDKISLPPQNPIPLIAAHRSESKNQNEINQIVEPIEKELQKEPLSIQKSFPFEKKVKEDAFANDTNVTKSESISKTEKRRSLITKVIQFVLVTIVVFIALSIINPPFVQQSTDDEEENTPGNNDIYEHVSMPTDFKKAGIYGLIAGSLTVALPYIWNFFH